MFFNWLSLAFAPISLLPRLTNPDGPLFGSWLIVRFVVIGNSLYYAALCKLLQLDSAGTLWTTMRPSRRQVPPPLLGIFLIPPSTFGIFEFLMIQVLSFQDLMMWAGRQVDLSSKPFWPRSVQPV